MAASAPTTAIGYTQAPQYSQIGYEDELTPELQWPQSIIVYDQMRRTDSQVASVLRAVTLPVRRTPWRVDPNGARDEVVQLVADDLGLPIVGQKPKPLPRTKERFSWSEHLRLALLMLPMGHSYFEQIYRVDDDATRAHLSKLEWRPSKTIEDIEVGRDGGLVSIKQYWTQTDTEPKPIPVDRLVAYIHEREGGNWLGSSVLRSCYKNWLLKDRLLRVQAQTIERNGMGIPVYEAAETERSLASGLALTQSLRAGAAAGTAIPFGAKLRLMGVEGTLPDADPVVKYHDEAIARAVLAHFLNLGTQTGSWALGTTFADFFTMSLQTLAQQIADVANKHIIEDLVDVNFGEQEPAPLLVWDEIGSRQAATAQAIKLLVDAGLITPDQVLDETLRQQYGLPPADPATAKPAPTQGEPSRAPEPEPTPGEGSVAASAESSVAAKYDPAQKRDSDGQWTDGLPGTSSAADKLKLASRIQLREGESLSASGRFAPAGEYTPNEALMAAVDTPSGRELRLGIIREDDRSRWRAANLGSTVQLDAAAVARLDQNLADVSSEMGRVRKESQALVAKVEGVEYGYNTANLPEFEGGSMTPAEYHEFSKQAFSFGPEVTPEQRETILKIYDTSGRPASSGVLADGPWGQLRYEIVPDAEEADTPADVTVEIRLGVRPADAPADWDFSDLTGSEMHLPLAEKDLKKLRAKVAELTGSPIKASRRFAVSRSYSHGRSAQVLAEPVLAHLSGTHNQKDHGRRLPKTLTGDSPFAGFTRQQLQKAARRRGIELEPREDRASIERKLAKHLAGDDGDKGGDKPEPAKAEPGSAESAPTATPTRMTEAQYTTLLKEENVRLHLLDGKSDKEAKSAAGAKASIDELKERNTALRKALRRKGVDYRTEEQKRADDEEKNQLLDEVERLAVAGGHDGPAKRAGASKMSRRELASFVADAKEFQERQNAKREAQSKGSAAVSAFDAAEAGSRATPRQVGYIKGLLRERGLSDGGAPGPTSSDDIRKLSNAEARAYINRLLRGDY